MDGLSGVAAAVIQQALEDARPGSPVTDQDRHAALLFLFGESAGWADSRRRWFTMANLHVPSREALRRAVDGPGTRRLNAAATRLGKALDRRDRGATTRGENAAA